MSDQPIRLTDPAVIIAGIRQFGLAPDGSDLSDLEAAIERIRTEQREATDTAQAKPEKFGKIATAISLFASCIKSGDEWTHRCETATNEAFDALRNIGGTLAAAHARIDELERERDALSAQAGELEWERDGWREAAKTAIRERDLFREAAKQEAERSYALAAGLLKE